MAIPTHPTVAVSLQHKISEAIGTTMFEKDSKVEKIYNFE